MGRIQIPHTVIQEATEAQVRRAGSNFSEGIAAYLGNPITGEIEVTSTDKDGLYWIYGLGTEPASAFTATNDGLRKEDFYGGCPIVVKRETNGYVILKKNPNAAPQFFKGAEARNDQTPIYISQFYYGTIHPYGSSLQLLVIGAQYDSDDVVDIITADFVTGTVQDTSAANITLPTVNNTAKGVLIQIDPTTETLSYKQSSTYAATIKPRQAYRAGLLPATDSGKYRVGYFNLTYGVTTFTYGDIWSCPEFIGGGNSAPIDATYIVQTANSELTNEQALSTLATGLLGVTTATGVISTGGTTGAVDNAVLRADGTGGKTVQSSSVTINDTGDIVANSIDLTVALPIADGGTGQTTQTAAFDALAPTTTKGDIIVSNGTDNIRLPVGTDTHVLTADSAEASGVKWVASSSGAPFIDSTAIIKGSADATKLLRLEVDGFTTATTRVLTPPNYDGTIATLAGTETFTNKTIDADGTGNVITNIGSSEVKAELITGLTADGTPDVTADYVMTYDASAAALKKVLVQNLVNITYAEYTFNDSADWQTTSTSFVDIDATDLSLNITTHGNPVKVHFHGTMTNSTQAYLDFTIDGTRHAGNDGIYRVSNTSHVPVSFTVLVPGLSAASHTFRMQWKAASAATLTLYAGAGTANNDLHGQFWVEEIS